MPKNARHNHSVTSAQYSKFFAMLKRAAQNLDLTSPADIDDYRHRVMREEAGVDSIKDMDRIGGYDACIRRFAIDAGDYLQAINIGIMDAKRKAYIVKMIAIEIMKLKGCSALDVRNYLLGVINQAGIARGASRDDDKFWLDASPVALTQLIQILDTYRRRLIKSVNLAH